LAQVQPFEWSHQSNMFALRPPSVLLLLSAVCVESARVANVDEEAVEYLAQESMPPSEPNVLLEANASAETTRLGAATAAPCFHSDIYYSPKDMLFKYRSYEATAEACQARCKRTNGCAHFSFWPDGGCHVQASYARAKHNSNDGVISGPPECGVEDVPGIPGAGDLHTFYMYRAQSEVEYDVASGLNLASAEGVLWYLHNEVVHTCNQGVRHYEITRIKRYQVTLRSTPELWATHRNFGLFLQFDKAKCTNGFCKSTFHTYGYIPGCIISSPRVANYWPAVWYSLPGQCPFREFADKTDRCRRNEPGGFCDHPDGRHTCTYHLEPAGEVSLQELTGVADCRQEGPEKGFWSGKADRGACNRRVHKLKTAFGRKYRDLPSDLDVPDCDVHLR